MSSSLARRRPGLGAGSRAGADKSPTGAAGVRAASASAVDPAKHFTPCSGYQECRHCSEHVKDGSRGPAPPRRLLEHLGLCRVVPGRVRAKLDARAVADARARRGPYSKPLYEHFDVVGFMRAKCVACDADLRGEWRVLQQHLTSCSGGSDSEPDDADTGKGRSSPASRQAPKPLLLGRRAGTTVAATSSRRSSRAGAGRRGGAKAQAAATGGATSFKRKAQRAKRPIGEAGSSDDSDFSPSKPGASSSSSDDASGSGASSDSSDLPHPLGNLSRVLKRVGSAISTDGSGSDSGRGGNGSDSSVSGIASLSSDDDAGNPTAGGRGVKRHSTGNSTTARSVRRRYSTGASGTSASATAKSSRRCVVSTGVASAGAASVSSHTSRTSRRSTGSSRPGPKSQAAPEPSTTADDAQASSGGSAGHGGESTRGGRQRGGAGSRARRRRNNPPVSSSPFTALPLAAHATRSMEGASIGHTRVTTAQHFKECPSKAGLPWCRCRHCGQLLKSLAAHTQLLHMGLCARLPVEHRSELDGAARAAAGQRVGAYAESFWKHFRVDGFLTATCRLCHAAQKGTAAQMKLHLERCPRNAGHTTLQPALHPQPPSHEAAGLHPTGAPATGPTGRRRKRRNTPTFSGAAAPTPPPPAAPRHTPQVATVSITLGPGAARAPTPSASAGSAHGALGGGFAASASSSNGSQASMPPLRRRTTQRRRFLKAHVDRMSEMFWRAGGVPREKAQAALAEELGETLYRVKTWYNRHRWRLSQSGPPRPPVDTGSGAGAGGGGSGSGSRSRSGSGSGSGSGGSASGSGAAARRGSLAKRDASASDPPVPRAQRRRSRSGPVGSHATGSLATGSHGAPAVVAVDDLSDVVSVADSTTSSDSGVPALRSAPTSDSCDTKPTVGSKSPPSAVPPLPDAHNSPTVVAKDVKPSVPVKPTVPVKSTAPVKPAPARSQPAKLLAKTDDGSCSTAATAVDHVDDVQHGDASSAGRQSVSAASDEEVSDVDDDDVVFDVSAF